MDVRATAKYIRVSPRKMQLLAKQVADLSPQKAIELLSSTNKSGAKPLLKVIKSAVANAENKNIAQKDELKFVHINVLSAGGMKRYRPVARGMAHEYKRRMSHVRLVLTTKSKNQNPKTK